MGLCDINRGPEIPQTEWTCPQCRARIRRESASQALPNNKLYIWCDACGWSEWITEDAQWGDCGYGQSTTPRPLAHMCDPPEREPFFPNYTTAASGPDVD